MRPLYRTDCDLVRIGRPRATRGYQTRREVTTPGSVRPSSCPQLRTIPLEGFADLLNDRLPKRCFCPSYRAYDGNFSELR